MNELRAEKISVALRGRAAVSDVSLELDAGELTAVIGPNGAGKTTLLRALAGLQALDAGRIWLIGKDLRAMPRRMLARQLSFVPQNTAFPFAFTVREVVATGRNPHLGRFQREQAVDRDAIEAALELTDTSHLASRPVTELSGGERQRVMIARSLATQAETILLDEPTANLDPAHAIDILDLCRSMSSAGKLVVLTTQDLTMTVRYADRVVLMKSGKIVASGTRDEVFTESALSSVFEVKAARAFTANGDETLIFRSRHAATRKPSKKTVSDSGAAFGEPEA